MVNPENLTPGRFTHGFYYDGFLPVTDCQHCKNTGDKGFMAPDGVMRCNQEKTFFEETVKDIMENFQLDEKDIFQLPQMVMNMIKLKRINRWQADKGLTGKTILFNPKTGMEHSMNTPGVLNRDSYYAQRSLMEYLDKLRLSRQSRDAKDGIDVLHKMMFRKKDKKDES